MVPIRNSYIFALISLSAFSLFAMTPADKEEYEKLGLSQVEWDMILNARMPKSKLYDLLRCGISIPEYFTRPWEQIGISEADWIDKRRSGMSSAEIQTSEKAVQASAYRCTHGEWIPIQSFFLPGVYQFFRKQTTKGYIMSGLALVGIGVSAGYSVKTRTFQPWGLLFLVPDMLWSGIDMGIQIQKEQNPDAARFTRGQPLPGSIAVAVSVQLR